MPGVRAENGDSVTGSVANGGKNGSGTEVVGGGVARKPKVGCGEVWAGGEWQQKPLLSINCGRSERLGKRQTPDNGS